MTNPAPVRTRIAPSPTGDPHLGTAYMALFNWAFARRHGGQFIVRIEDTDQARSTRESEAMIFAALSWLGLSWDEGADVGGPHGPYRQSERLDVYQEPIERLIRDGHAFHCFCTTERLDEMRAAQRAEGKTQRYDGHCIGLSADEVRARIEAGEPHVVRMRVPDTGESVFQDELRGEIRIPYEQVDMQVLLKADGFPTYHLAVVVDDHLMRISHVLRGEEWINSVPKMQLLYDYLGWDMPRLAHLPLLRNPDQSKLSKRKNPTSVNYYQRRGFLAPALANYLGTMGYSMPDEREIFSVQAFCDEFDLSRVSLGGPIFDVTKLKWMNGQYLRALDPDAFMDEVAGWLLNRERLAPLVALVQERTETLDDLAAQVDYLVGERRPLTIEDFAHKTLSEDQVRQILHHTSRLLDEQRSWERDALFGGIKGLADALGMKIRDFLFPLFIATSGRTVSLPLFDSLMYLGPDVSRVRVREGLAVVGLSKKQTKSLDKAYAALTLAPAANSAD